MLNLTLLLSLAALSAGEQADNESHAEKGRVPCTFEDSRGSHLLFTARRYVRCFRPFFHLPGCVSSHHMLPPKTGEFVKKSDDTFKVKSKHINVHSSVSALPNHAFGIMAPAKKQFCRFSLMKTQQGEYISHQKPFSPPEVGRVSFLAGPPPPSSAGCVRIRTWFYS